MRWTGVHAVVTLPEHIDVSNAGQIREQLLSIINLGAAELVADMTATVSCDHAGADAVARAYQRAAAAGTQLRLVVPAPIVRRGGGHGDSSSADFARGSGRPDGSPPFRTGRAPTVASSTAGGPQNCGHHPGRVAEPHRRPRRRSRAGRR